MKPVRKTKSMLLIVDRKQGLQGTWWSLILNNKDTEVDQELSQIIAILSIRKKELIREEEWMPDDLQRGKKFNIQRMQRPKKYLEEIS